ncbi:MAG: O-antigen ligase family protein [Armatimonadota bacterium]
MQLLVFIILSFLLFYLPLDYGGHSIRAQAVLMVFAYLSAALYAVSSDKKSLSNLKSFIWPSILFLIVFFISTINSACVYESLYSGLLFTAYFLVFIVIANMFKDEYSGKFAVFLAFAVMLFSIAGLFFYKSTNLAGFDSDFYSTFYQKNTCAGFLILTLPVMLSLFLADKRSSKVIFLGVIGCLSLLGLLFTLSHWSWLILFIVALIFMLVASYEVILFGLTGCLSLLGLLFTQSRWSWLVFIAVFIFIFVSIYKYIDDKKAVFKKLFILLFVFLIFIPVFSAKKNQERKVVPSFIKEELTSIANTKEPSKLARIEFYKIAFAEFKDHPLTGVGLSNFPAHLPKYEKDPRYYSKFAHNFYLKILCELGIFGFVLMCIILFLILREYIRALKLSRNTPHYPLILGLSTGCVCLLMHIMAHVDWLFSASFYYFFFFTGIIFYYSSFLSNKGKDEKPVSIKYYDYLIVILLVIISAGIMVMYFAQNKADIAQYYQRKGSFSDAVLNYKKAVGLNPWNPEYRRELASAYYYNFLKDPEKEYLNKGIIQATEAVNLQKLKVNNYIVLAKLYKIKSRNDLYAENLQKALNIDPVNYPSLYNDLAVYYLENGDIAKSRELIEKVLSLYKDEYFPVMLSFRREELKKQVSDSYVIYASINTIEGGNKKAKECLFKALELNENNLSAIIALGVEYYDDKEYNEAVKYLKKAVEMDQSIEQLNIMLKKALSEVKK